MRIQRLLTTAAAALVLGMSACENEELLPPANQPVDPLFERYVSLGNSITAGIQSGGLNDSLQAWRTRSCSRARWAPCSSCRT